VDTSTTPNVLQNYWSLTTLLDRVNWQKGLGQGCHLRALCIGALNVVEWRKEPKEQCSLLCADVVQNHITENVCQGTVEHLHCLYVFFKL
jgi:hypothetical protein